MKIAIYADIPNGAYGGIQQYIEKLTKSLIENTDHKILIITNRVFYDQFFKQFEQADNFKTLISNNKQKIFTILFYNRYSRIISSLIFNKILFISKLSEYIGNIKPAILKYKPDVIHFPLPNMQVYNWDIPVTVSLHDLQHEYFPEFFSKTQLYLRNLHFKKSARECNQVIVSFEHVKKDIHKIYQIPLEKITVTSLGAENRFEQVDIISKEELLNQFNLPEHFIFFPAQTWKHKNHITLLKALVLLREEYKKKIFLVCSGMKNNYFSEINKFIKENALENQTTFLGFISNRELFSLYKYADLVVIPTLYEAGSFPLFEAMSIGCPVICSNVTSLPETIGDERFIFNPLSEAEIADKILYLLEDAEIRQQNIRNSYNQIKNFSWALAVKNFEKAYSNAIENYKTHGK